MSNTVNPLTGAGVGRIPPRYRGASGAVRWTMRHLVPHLLLIGLALIFILPFVWLVSTSLKPDSQIFVLPPEWVPHPFKWSNYPEALTYIPYFLYMRNSLYIALFNVCAMLISCSLVAYGFARIHWPGRNLLFIVLLATMMIPYPVTLIPVFVIFRQIGWVGSFNALTWPALTGSAFYIFLLRQFFMTIPQDLADAARVDGASEFQIYRRIILPLAKPALATVAILVFLDNWNDFLGPLIYLGGNQQDYTLALGLNDYFGAHSAEWALLMAAVTVMVIPVAVLFFVSQRTFIQGIALTGRR